MSLPSHVMNIITKDPMNYKTYLKNNETILIKLRIIKHRVVDKLQVNEIAKHYSMHRNSVSNIMALYDSKASLILKEKIIKNLNITGIVPKKCVKVKIV